MTDTVRILRSIHCRDLYVIDPESELDPGPPWDEHMMWWAPDIGIL